MNLFIEAATLFCKVTSGWEQEEPEAEIRNSCFKRAGNILYITCSTVICRSLPTQYFCQIRYFEEYHNDDLANMLYI